MTYSVQANPTGLARTGLVNIAGQVLTVSQDPAPCTYALGFTTVNYRVGLTNDQVSVTTLTGCVWTAASGTNWITVSSAANNTNSGTVTYTVQANPTGLPRTGTVSIAGQVLTVSQDAAACTYALGFNNINYRFGSTNDQVSVSTLTGCVWTAVSGTNWIVVNSAANNTNSGVINYSVQANPTGLARTGLVNIAGQVLTISQDPAPCTYTLGFTSVNYRVGLTNDQVSMTTLTGCVWTAVSGTNWITVNSAAN